MLDQHQLSAMNESGNVLVTACPGSGKSRLLSNKAAHILNNGRATVCTVTFTRDAAEELKVKIRALCNKNPKDRLIAGTFHSVALLQLRNSGINIKPIGAAERNALIRLACKQADVPFNTATSIIDYAKSHLETNILKNDMEMSLFKAYQQLLSQSDSYDFSDLLLMAVKKMKAGELKPLSVDYLLVDEAQDSDTIQLAWILEHVKAGVEVMLVGDEDQSIYGWRNARGFGGMMLFVKHSSATHVSLNTNYRCAPHIINHSTQLIAHNKERFTKNIMAAQLRGGIIETIKTLDRGDEARRVADLIQTSNADTWGLLARTNRLLLFVEVELQKRNIPYKRVGGEGFWETPKAAALMSLLKSVVEPKKHSWITVLQGARVSEDALNALIQAAKHSGKPSWQALVAATEDHKVLPFLEQSPELAETVESLARLYPIWDQNFKKGFMKLGITGVSRWLENYWPNMKSHKKDDDDFENFSILDWACKAILDMKHPTLKERLHTLMVKQIMASRRSEEEDQQKIKLMTMHAAKGLEFSNVVVLGCESKYCPFEKKADKEGSAPIASVEEERRLFYVAMTRAKNNLYLTYTDHPNAPSVFLTEAGLKVSDR